MSKFKKEQVTTLAPVDLMAYLRGNKKNGVKPDSLSSWVECKLDDDEKDLHVQNIKKRVQFFANKTVNLQSDVESLQLQNNRLQRKFEALVKRYDEKVQT
jgi:hypothetical protein